MTYIIYGHQQLHLKSIARLKQIYSEIGCTVEVSDKRYKDAWITAITKYQSSKVQKLTPAVPDEQTAAQAELDGFIAAQAQAIAPELLTTVEINSNHYEIYAGKQLITYIAYDHNEFITQPWLVIINGEEKFRDTTVARCQRYIEWHHQDGTLNPFAPTEVPEVPQISELSFYDQEAFVNRELIAGIFYDHDNYENFYWRVIINDKEIFRDTTSARCHSYVKQQYQQGTLPMQEPFEEEAEELLALSEGEEIFPLHPTSSSCATGNEIMAQIFNECEKYGFEILDDGIYYEPSRTYSNQMKEECLKMYLNGMGFRGIERVKGVHHTTMITWVKQLGQTMVDAPSQDVHEGELSGDRNHPGDRNIPLVGELDELETFVGSKKIKSGCGQQ